MQTQKRKQGVVRYIHRTTKPTTPCSNAVNVWFLLSCTTKVSRTQTDSQHVVHQVWRDSGWRWCHVGRQLQTAMNTSKSASSRRLYSPARATAMADSITLEKYASGSLQVSFANVELCDQGPAIAQHHVRLRRQDLSQGCLAREGHR